GRPKLESFQFRIRATHRNANRSRTIARGIREVHRRLKARHETFVTIRCRRSKGYDRGRVLQQATDIKACKVRQSGVTVAGKERLLTLPERLVTVHSGTVVA